MSSLEKNIKSAINDFHNIRDAIKEKNSTFPLNTPTAEYKDYILSIPTYILDFSEALWWLQIGNIDLTNINTNITIEQILSGDLYAQLLDNEAAAAYAAYSSYEISQLIKRNVNYLALALTSKYKQWFFNSERNFTEHIDELVDSNPYVTAENHANIKCSSEQPEYLAYYAFDNSIDDSNVYTAYKDRHIWLAYGENQWVQYSYTSPKQLYSVDIYSVRDNAPTMVTIYGSELEDPTEDDLHLLATQELSGIKGADHFDTVICGIREKYRTYRFVIKNSVVDEEINSSLKMCIVGEIVIHTFKEE